MAPVKPKRFLRHLLGLIVFRHAVVVAHLKTAGEFVILFIVESPVYAKRPAGVKVELGGDVHVVIDGLVPSKIAQTEAFAVGKFKIAGDDDACLAGFGNGIKSKWQHQWGRDAADFHVGETGDHQFIGYHF